MAMPLTPTQTRVLEFIAQHIVEKQRPPTRKEISRYFGWSAVNSAEGHIKALAAAEARAKLGMSRAAAAVEFDMPGWIERAVDALRRAASVQVGVFTIEQMRAVLEPDLPTVHELRAWGRVTQLASDRGYIEAAPRVFIPAASSNACPKPAWRKGPNA